MVLSVMSINVTGINNCAKRQKLFYYLRRKKYDVIYLQETHSSPKVEKFWRSQWGGRAFFTHGESNSRGAAILLRKNLGLSVKFLHKDEDGRFIALEVEYEMLNFVFANIYAPNVDDKVFFTEITDRIAKIPIDFKIMGGDFNLVLDVDKDKEGGKAVTHTHSVSVLKTFMQSENMIDVWRTQHLYDQTYTWYRKKPEFIQCRLDFFLISKMLLPLCMNSDILASFMSDHARITLSLEINNDKRGPGFWKLNTSLLEDINYLNLIRELIQEVLQLKFDDVRSKWDYLKFKVKTETIQYASFKKKCYANQLEVLERKLKTIQSRLSNKSFLNISLFTEQEDIHLMEEIKDEIDELVAIKVRGAMVRSRANWYQYGEKPSKYFLKLEQANNNKKTRYRLKRDRDGVILTNQKDILKEQERFYSELYSYHSVEHHTNYLKGIQSPKLSYWQKLDLESSIDRAEMLIAQREMKTDKSPGPDGIPIEFYRTFWTDLEDILYALIVEMSSKGLTPDQGRGIISLVEKQGRDLLEIKNWRPISLLNVDAKLYSKILANRLYKVLPDIIHPDQTGFLPNRYLGENVLDAVSLIEYTKKHGLEGMIISVDIEKAFDSTHWEVMYSFLEFFNFGSEYCNMIRMLYKEISSCTVNNGYSSPWFKIHRGQRQGDCLSPPLFLVFAEILGLKIRQNENIEGFDINGQTKKTVAIC